MLEHRYGYRKTARKYELSEIGSTVDLLKQWERIYIEEGAEGLYEGIQGRTCESEPRKGRPRNWTSR